VGLYTGGTYIKGRYSEAIIFGRLIGSYNQGGALGSAILIRAKFLPEEKSKYSLVKIVVKIFIKINRSKNVSSSAKMLRLCLPGRKRRIFLSKLNLITIHRQWRICNYCTSLLNYRKQRHKNIL
jgi:hypothetical protein